MVGYIQKQALVLAFTRPWLRGVGGMPPRSWTEAWWAILDSIYPVYTLRALDAHHAGGPCPLEV
jgi:hypothetical protein